MCTSLVPTTAVRGCWVDGNGDDDDDTDVGIAGGGGL